MNFEAGIEMVDRAIRSNPNFAQAYNSRGWLRIWDGGSDAAIADFEQAMRFSPRDPFSYALMLGIALGHFNACRHADAAIWANRSIQSFPYFIAGLTTAAACYVEAGRLEDAQKVKADVLRLSPGWRPSPIGSGPIAVSRGVEEISGGATEGGISRMSTGKRGANTAPEPPEIQDSIS